MRYGIVALLALLAACGTPSEPTSTRAISNTVQMPGERDLSAFYDVDAANTSEKALTDLALLESRGVIKPPEAKIRALRTFLIDRDYTGWPADHAPRLNNIRMTGPAFLGDSYSTHARVRIYYSLGVVEWLLRRERAPDDPNNVLPEGSMIVKEMYPPIAPAKPGDPDPLSGWAVMVRDTSVSYDGWLWYLYYLPANETNHHEFELAQYGMSFCLSCHASTSNPEGTFAALGNITGEDYVTYVEVPPGDGPVIAPSQPGGHTPVKLPEYCEQTEVTLMECMAYRAITQPLESPDPAFLAQYGLSDPAKPMQLPPDIIFDHVVAGPDNHSGLVTADACEGCHDATNLLKATMTHMTIAAPEPMKQQGIDWINLGQMGEWTGSLMGRSSRDPIFRAQAEYEVLAAPERADETLQTCMRCHAPMGQHQLAKDKGPDATLTLAMLEATPESANAEDALYGALGRDGVSCAICHKIKEDGLGKPETFTGHFKLEDGNKIFGPYKDVNANPMQNGLGMTPEHAPQITDSALCGSCHTVQLPVYGSSPEKQIYEQTTYFEWLNSNFSDPNGSEFAPCINCHMPDTNPLDGSKLSFKIANIEDNTFPFVPNRMAPDELAIPERSDYRRHTLVGLNRFVQAMFSQFPLDLGSSTFEPNRIPTMLPSQVLAKMATVEMAKSSTATLDVTASMSNNEITADVSVTNLAGHKLPSGVGFRRAFLEIAVLDAQGQTLWCSGCTDSLGLILGSDGQPLPSEFNNKNAYEPDYASITNANQVQIYESRHTDCSDSLTTSFMHLCNEVKDNRILPTGWSINGEYGKETEPKFIDGAYEAGKDTVALRVPAADLANAAAVRARLIYQATPPYYLRDRFATLTMGEAPNTKALAYMTSHLNIKEEGDISDWKLVITEHSASLHSAHSAGGDQKLAGLE